MDDEPLARKVLREELSCLDEVEVVAEADNGELALQTITSVFPDIVFLDAQMPAMGGFELISRLSGGPLPAIIMVTAFDHHALQAFTVGAVDYLLKPVSPARLKQALEKAVRLLRSPQAVAEEVVHLQHALSPTVRPPQVQRIVGRSGCEYFLLNPDDVLAFQANGDSVSILTTKGIFIALQNLRTIEDRFRNGPFRRIHRNAVVNLNRIQKMSMITSQRWLITLSDGHEFVVSKRQARLIRAVIHE